MLYNIAMSNTANRNNHFEFTSDCCKNTVFMKRSGHRSVFYSIKFVEDDYPRAVYMFYKYVVESGKDGNFGLYNLDFSYMDLKSKGNRETLEMLAAEEIFKCLISQEKKCNLELFGREDLSKSAFGNYLDHMIFKYCGDIAVIGDKSRNVFLKYFEEKKAFGRVLKQGCLYVDNVIKLRRLPAINMFSDGPKKLVEPYYRKQFNNQEDLAANGPNSRLNTALFEEYLVKLCKALHKDGSVLFY